MGVMAREQTGLAQVAGPLFPSGWAGALTGVGTPSAPSAPGPASGGVFNSVNLPPRPPQFGKKTGSAIASRVKSRDRNYPRRVSLIAIGLGNKHVNALFGGFEQGAGVASGLEFTTADRVPGVEFRAMALVSTRLYRTFELSAYAPKVGDERTHAEARLNYTRRTKINFFGIGPRTSEANRTNFDLEQRSFYASLFRDFTNSLEVGIYGGVADADAYRGKDNRDQPIDSLFSGRPTASPLTRWAPGLNSGSKIVSYGVYGEYDRRNNERGLTRGFYFYGRLASNDGLEKGAFSDYGWVEAELDVRGYIPLGSHKTSLAPRALAELKQPKGGSQIPFYHLSFLGGRTHLRGFDNFRFYGENSLLLSVEVRRTVYTQSEDKGVDVMVFGDAGQVWGDSRLKTDPVMRQHDRFAAGNWRAGIGGGIRYRLSKDASFRMDIAHSNEVNKVYFSVTRGF
jgi:outer membrane protein assembly factor BamA